jgi:hypothetical protein
VLPGLLVSPWWLPELHQVSQVCAEVAPILGATLAAVTQISIKLYEAYKKAKFRRDIQIGLKELGDTEWGSSRLSKGGQASD